MKPQIKFFIKSTRFKTTIWYSSLFLFLEILIGVSIYSYLNLSLNKELDHSLSRQAEAVFNLITKRDVDLANFEPDSVYASPEELIYDLIYESVTFNLRNTYIQVMYNDKIIFVTDNLGNVVLKFPEIEAGKVVFATENDSKVSSRSDIRFAYLQKNNYRIIVAFPTAFIAETLSNVTDIFIKIAPLFFFISIAGGFLISARSLSRIDSIIKKTEEITAANLDEKIEGEEFRDEYGRLARTMNAMIKRIKTSIDYMNQFSISASHELKTPLTILRGEIEVALKSPKSAEEYREILLSNYEETIRLSGIVEKLFLISKIDNTLITLRKEFTHINKFLEEIHSRLGQFGREKNIHDKLELMKDVPVEIDRELMREAIFNLLDNAVKYGDEEQDVILKNEVVNNFQTKISVINKGEGIPPDCISRVFDRFYRVETSRNRDTGGAGIGLAVVKSITAWHNGEVGVKSIPGDTTEFFILLNYIKD
jgi:signal transduction histidine kinase